jgi:hypothetical protein
VDQVEARLGLFGESVNLGTRCNTLGVKLANQLAFAFHKHKHHSSILDFKHMLVAIIHPMVALFSTLFLYVILSVHIRNSSA